MGVGEMVRDRMDRVALSGVAMEQPLGNISKVICIVQR